jgi:hypothetical protein
VRYELQAGAFRPGGPRWRNKKLYAVTVEVEEVRCLARVDHGSKIYGVRT